MRAETATKSHTADSWTHYQDRNQLSAAQKGKYANMSIIKLGYSAAES
jgi:hypothetical protein